MIDVDGYGFMVAVDDFFVIRSLWKGRDRAAVERIGCCWCSFFFVVKWYFWCCFFFRVVLDLVRFIWLLGSLVVFSLGGVVCFGLDSFLRFALPSSFLSLQHLHRTRTLHYVRS